MLHRCRHALLLGLALSLVGLTASAQDAKKEKAADGAVERALEQSKASGVPILAVGGRET